jgi:hypothetical protein
MAQIASGSAAMSADASKDFIGHHGNRTVTDTQPAPFVARHGTGVAHCWARPERAPP